MMRSRFFHAMFCTAAAAICSLAPAQEYPTKPIRFIVPGDPGTNPDVLARVIGAEMAKVLGQPLVIENRSGVNSIVGYETVAKAPPDGYTIGVASVQGL